MADKNDRELITGTTRGAVALPPPPPFPAKPQQRPAAQDPTRRTGTPSLPPLTEREELFCLAVVKDLSFNYSEAYREVFPGTSPRSVQPLSSKLAGKPSVKARIRELLEERKNRCLVEADRVVYELAVLSFVDPLYIYNDDGTLKKLEDMGMWRRAIKSIKTEEGKDGAVIKHVTFYDKLIANDKLGKHVGMWNKEDMPVPPIQVNNEEGGNVQVNIYIPDNGRDK